MSWKHFLRIYTSVAVTPVVMWPVHYKWKWRIMIGQRGNISQWFLTANWGFVRIAAHVLRTVQWKHLPIAIVLCPNFGKMSFSWALVTSLFFQKLECGSWEVNWRLLEILHKWSVSCKQMSCIAGQRGMKQNSPCSSGVLVALCTLRKFPWHRPMNISTLLPQIF